MQPGETRTLTFQVTIPASRAAGPIVNTAGFAYDPDGPGGNPTSSTTPTNPFTFTVTQSTAVTVGDSTVPTAAQASTVIFTNLVTNFAPRVQFCRQNAVIQASPTAVLFSGLYLFTLAGQPVLAHYSFLIVRTNDGWRIAHHLSSPWPGPVQAQCERAR